MSTPKVNDFVRFKKDKWDKKYKQESYTKDNIFKIIENIGDYYRLDEFQENIKKTDTEPVPIDGISDNNVYYDPIVAASIIGPNETPPVHRTNYEYYLDAFKKSTYPDGRTMYQIVKDRKYKYVHEIQQWLRRDFGWEDLRIKYNYKPLSEVYAQRLWNLKKDFKSNGVPEHLFVYELCNLFFIKFAYNNKVAHFKYSWNDLTSLDSPLPQYKENIDSIKQYPYLTSNEILKIAIKYINNIQDNQLAEVLDLIIEKEQIISNSLFAQYSTNKVVLQTIIKALRPRSGENWDDPAAGVCGSLIAIKDYQKGLNEPSVLSGCEINESIWWIGQCNLLFHDIPCLLEHKNVFERKEKKYDGVICDIPLGNVKIQGKSSYPIHTDNRLLNFIMEICTSLKERNSSRAAFLITDSFFTSKQNDFIALKKYLFDNFKVNTILRLPKELLSYTVPVSVVFISRNKETSDGVWIYNARCETSNSIDIKAAEKALSRFISRYLYYEQYAHDIRKGKEWKSINISEIINDNYCFDIDLFNNDRKLTFQPWKALKEAIRLSGDVTNDLQGLYNLILKDDSKNEIKRNDDSSLWDSDKK